MGGREHVVAVIRPLSSGGIVRWRSFRNRQYLQFTGDGFTNYQNGNFVYCDATRNRRYARQIVLNVQGRAHMMSRRDDAATASIAKANRSDADSRVARERASGRRPRHGRTCRRQRQRRHIRHPGIRCHDRDIDRAVHVLAQRQQERGIRGFGRDCPVSDRGSGAAGGSLTTETVHGNADSSMTPFST
ncbi:MAG: hypothetical protein CMQ24_12340 [Gammaproteobacteria bacterium]|nr:hypothetical protein [Gammaproteobacteria bacterium]